MSLSRNYEIPVYLGLTQQPLIGGVPDGVAVFLLTFWSALAFGTRLFLFSLIGWLVTWSIMVFVTRLDPDFKDIFYRYWIYHRTPYLEP